MTAGSTVLAIAGLTLREASRRRLLWALVGLTVVLLGLSGWGFARLAAVMEQFGELDSGEGRFVSRQLLNLVMLGLRLIAVLCTAFLAGPTMVGEVVSVY